MEIVRRGGFILLIDSQSAAVGGALQLDMECGGNAAALALTRSARIKNSK